MSESTLTSTFEDIQVIAGLEMGWGRTPKNWTSTNDTDFGIACKEGYRSFLYPQTVPGERKSHNWSFLYPMGTLQLTEGYSTGSIADISGVTVGGSGTTWTSVSDWIPNAVLEVTVDSGNTVHNEIASVNSNTSLTLKAVTHTWEDPTLATLSSYVIRRDAYYLPDDFGGMVSDSFTYRRDEQWQLPQIKIVGEAEIRKIDRVNSGDIYPRYATIVPIAPVAQVSGTGGKSTRWMVKFYPLPEQTYYLEYRYHAIPPALDEDTNIYHYGGAEHSQTIVAAVIDALYRRVHASNEKREEFLTRLHQSILHDRRNYQPGNLGRGTGYEYGREALRGFRESTPTGNITTTFN